MAQVYLCFLWHMHQPFYKDLLSGEYKLPWTRMHGLKDYYGMARLLEDFPAIRQTFNLVPSLVAQVHEYAEGKAHDPFLRLALKPAESLTPDEKLFLLRNSFHAYAPRMIYRYPRYGELFDARQANGDNAVRIFGPQEFRDLQILSQLAWFDEEFQDADEEVARLVSKGRGYSLEDQAMMERKQLAILRRVMPEYRKLAASGQIEISTTPFYHPILPLLCDSNIAGVSHPNVPLPSRFRYPGDARTQLALARDFIAREFGSAPVGLWPSEGSVSDEVFEIAGDLGFQWTATDSGVLSRTLGYSAGVEQIYRPYLWERDGRKLQVIFRDHYLSDLIGFVYSRMDAQAAAADFLHRIRQNTRVRIAQGHDVLVPIILDGENAWEYYEKNGRPFLSHLYRLISEDGLFAAVTVSEALARLQPHTIHHIVPGSWINANFDVWIGAEEDNHAWEQLLRAREAYDAHAAAVPEDRRTLAWEELLIAEGSDWCWWYGPEHDSANRPEFDQLFRDHLANVYRALNLAPPEELSRPILRIAGGAHQIAPTGAIEPVVDGEVTSYFEWIGAGSYRIDERSGAMHGKKVVLQEVFFGSGPGGLYLRLDFVPGAAELDGGIDIRCTLQRDEGAQPGLLEIRVAEGAARIAASRLPSGAAQCAFGRILEVRIPIEGDSTRLQLSVWQNGLPVEAIPQQGWITVQAQPTDWLA